MEEDFYLMYLAILDAIDDSCIKVYKNEFSFLKSLEDLYEKYESLPLSEAQRNWLRTIFNRIQ